MSEPAGGARWIELGVVARPHGVRGEVRVHLFNKDSTLLEELGEVFVFGEPGAEPALLEVESVRPGPKALLVRFAGIRSVDDAEELRGFTICVPREALPSLEEGEYYYADLIGLEAWVGATAVGTVVGVIDYPSVECLEVAREGGHLEVPMLSRWVERIDLEMGKVHLHNVDDIPLQRRR